MGSGNLGAIVRVIALALIAVGVWFLGKYDTGMPEPSGLDAPKSEFSAARADATLARILGPELPHPLSSVENANVRARIQAEFAALDVPTSVMTGLGCNGRAALSYFACGTTKNVIAEVAPGAGKAIVLLAHYDSVPAGPGAGDDASGVATILESVRAMKAVGIKTKHPIVALISDGEEAGLLGAAAFAHDPAMKARVGVVVNVEARGNQGPSLLFQTSPGDSKLIDLYAQSVPRVETSSLFAVIYKALPNDTDLTVFLKSGLTGFNFAFSGNVPQYHTSLDRRENLSLSTLQQHGNNMLGLTTGLMQTDFESLKGGDDIYITVFGWLPRLPASWALPLALLAFALVLLAGYLSRTRLNSIGQWAAALAIPPALVIGCIAAGWVVHAVASLVSGYPNPSYAHPVALRIALGFAVLAIVLLCSRMAQPRLAALSVWIWMALLAVLTAATLPGISPYFLFPALVASVVLVVQSRLDGAWTGLAGEIALLVAAIPALVIWLTLSAVSEEIQGLLVHPLFTVPAAFAMMTLVPLLAERRLTAMGWSAGFAGAGALALIAAIVGGMQPAYSAVAPQRLPITLVDNHIDNKAIWVAETAWRLPVSVWLGAFGDEKIPQSLRAAASFSAKPERAYPVGLGAGYVAPAGGTRFTPPSVTIDNRPDGNNRRLVLTLNGSQRANRMIVVLPKAAAVQWAEIGGQRQVMAKESANPLGTLVACVSDDCRTQTITLELASRKPFDMILGEQSYGLPADGMKIAAARPKEAVPSQNGDTVIVYKKVRIR